MARRSHRTRGFSQIFLGLLTCLPFTLLMAQPAFELSYRSEGAASLVGNVVLESKVPDADWPDIEVYLERVWREQGEKGVRILGQQFDTLGMRVFQPLLPFRPGTQYLAKAKGALPHTFQIAALDIKNPPKLLAIYPSVSEIPANQLKFYLVFDRPMRRGNVYQHLRLVDADGHAEMPFLPLQPELWDSSHQRLTLWLDPGRVKRDLVLNRTQGAPLVTGQEYTLHIDQAWRDRRGISLEQSYSHDFRVIAADRTSPDPESWEIIPVQAGTRDTLHIHFGEALDFALAGSALRLMGEDGRVLDGQTILGDDQQCWQFVPTLPWQAGTYKIRIDAKLEDLAGNNLNRLFDTDLEQEQRKKRQEFYWRSFSIPEE